MAVNANDWQFPIYPPLFQTDVFDWAMGEFERINGTIEGRIASTKEDAAILAQAVKNAGDGDYLEIGSLFGGSAILAALTKQAYGLRGRVVCVDDLLPLFEVRRTPEFILENAERLGVRDRIDIIVSHSYEWQAAGRYAAAYIDASHDYGSCKQDFEKVKDCVDRYVVFHDCDPAHSGVVQAVREAWPVVYLAEHTAVTEKP